MIHLSKMDDFHSYVELTRGSQCGVPSPEFPVQNCIWGMGSNGLNIFWTLSAQSVTKLGPKTIFQHSFQFQKVYPSFIEFHGSFMGYYIKTYQQKPSKKAIVLRFPGSGSCSIGSGWMIAPALEPSGYGL